MRFVVYISPSGYKTVCDTNQESLFRDEPGAGILSSGDHTHLNKVAAALNQLDELDSLNLYSPRLLATVQSMVAAAATKVHRQDPGAYPTKDPLRFKDGTVFVHEVVGVDDYARGGS